MVFLASKAVGSLLRHPNKVLRRATNSLRAKAHSYTGGIQRSELASEVSKGRAEPSSLEGRRPIWCRNMAGGSRLQINFLTEVFRRPLSRRSPWLCQTRATLRASRPHASQAVGPLFRKILNFHFKIFNFKLRASADGAEGGTRTPTPLRVLDPESSASANSATSAQKGF